MKFVLIAAFFPHLSILCLRPKAGNIELLYQKTFIYFFLPRLYNFTKVLYFPISTNFLNELVTRDRFPFCRIIVSV